METHLRATACHQPHGTGLYHTTRHPTQVNAPLKAKQAGTRPTYPKGRKTEWTSMVGYIPRWFYHLPTVSWSPSKN